MSDFLLNNAAAHVDSTRMACDVIDDLYYPRLNTVKCKADLTLGNLEGMAETEKYGYVNSLDAADNPSDIWALATDTASPKVETLTPLTVPATIYAASTDINDNDIDVYFRYIDDLGFEQNATINLDGQTGKSTGVSGLFINRAYISGDNQIAQGDIYFTSENNFTNGVPNDTTKILAFLPVNFGQTQQCLYRVPIDKVLLLRSVTISCSRASGGAGSADISFRYKPFGGSWRIRPYKITSEAPLNLENIRGVKADPGSLFFVRVEDVSDNQTSISAEWAGELIDVAV